MRRPAAIFLALSALAGSGCGDDSSDRSVALALEGGASNVNAVACGSQQPFEQYRRGDDVGYGGTVEPSPEGRWKAKVKIKRCQGGEFVELSSQKIVGLPDGRFQGVFDDLEPGSYQIRARYQGEDRPESHKLYFQVK